MDDEETRLDEESTCDARTYYFDIEMKLPKTQRTRDLSTFDKEATKTHLQTNYFQALTNKLQAVGKGSSPTKKILFRPGGCGGSRCVGIFNDKSLN